MVDARSRTVTPWLQWFAESRDLALADRRAGREVADAHGIAARFEADPAFYADPVHLPFTVGTGSGRALLLHGFPGTPAEMRPIAAVLAAYGWRCTAPLLPGFGPDIERLGSVRRDDWIAAARKAWDGLDGPAGPRLLVGFSMGAALAVRIAADDASVAAAPAPRSLLLVAPFTGVGDPRAALLPLVRRVIPQYRPFADADFSDPTLRGQLLRVDPDLDLDDPDVQTRVRREVTLPTRALDEVRRLGHEAWRAAHGLDWPTSVVQGHDDVIVPADRTRQFLQRLSGFVRYREVPGGHELVHPEAPGHEALLAALRAVVEAPSAFGADGSR